MMAVKFLCCSTRNMSAFCPRLPSCESSMKRFLSVTDVHPGQRPENIFRNLEIKIKRDHVWEYLRSNETARPLHRICSTLVRINHIRRRYAKVKHMIKWLSLKDSLKIGDAWF